MSNRAIGDALFKEKPDMKSVFTRHLDRTNHAASTSYESSVLQKLNNLPMKWREWVKDNAEKYTDNKDTYIFMAPLGFDIGSIEKPMLWDEKQEIQRYEDGSIDWSDPNIASPKCVVKPYLNYSDMDAVIMEAAEFASLTWSIDPLEQDAGDTEEYIVERKRTPFRKPRIPDPEG